MLEKILKKVLKKSNIWTGMMEKKGLKNKIFKGLSEGTLNIFEGWDQTLKKLKDTTFKFNKVQTRIATAVRYEVDSLTLRLISLLWGWFSYSDVDFLTLRLISLL